MQLEYLFLLDYLLCLNETIETVIESGYKNGSVIVPLQVHNTLFFAMVFLRHIYKLHHYFDSSLPLDILLFICNDILLFGHVVSMRHFYYVP